MGSPNSKDQREDENLESLSQEEIRQRRVEIMEQQQNSKQDEKVQTNSQNTPKKIAQVQEQINQISLGKNNTQEITLVHPIISKYGQQIFDENSYFEEVFKATIFKESLIRNPDLFYFDQKNEENGIKYFSYDNFVDVIQYILEHNNFKGEEKLVFLHNIQIRLQKLDPKIELFANQFSLDPSQKHELCQIAMSYIISYLIDPSCFSKEIKDETREDIEDYQNEVYNYVFEQLLDFESDDFIMDLIQAQHEDYDKIFFPILKRIYRNCKVATIRQPKNAIASLNLFRFLIEKDSKFLDLFLRSRLFLPEILSGQNIERYTLLGVSLSISPFNQQILSTRNIKLEKLDEQVKEQRKIMDQIIHLIYEILKIILKRSKEAKQLVCNWMQICVDENRDRQKNYFNPNKVASEGWLVNFLAVLIKFCSLKWDRKSVDQINYGYITSQQIFDNVLLLKGTNNFVIPLELQQEERKSNYDSEKLLPKKKQQQLDCTHSQETLTQLNGSEKYVFLSNLLFLTNEVIHCLIPTIKEYITKKIILDNQKTRVSQFMDPSININEQVVARYRVQMSNPIFLEMIIKQLKFNCIVLLNGYDISLNDMENLNFIFEKIEKLSENDILNGQSQSGIPFYWLEDISDILKFILLLDHTLLKRKDIKEEINLLLIFMVAVVRKDNWINNPHLRASYIEFLYLLADKAQFPYLNLNTILQKNDLLYETFLINLMDAAIKYFIQADKIGSQNLLDEKYAYRNRCCSLMNFCLEFKPKIGEISLLEERILQKTFYDLETGVKFIVFYLDDIDYFYNQIFDKIKEIQDSEQQQQEQISQIDENNADYDRIIQHIQNSGQQINQSNRLLTIRYQKVLSSYLRLLDWLTLNFPKILLREEIKQKLIHSFNFSLKQMFISDSGGSGILQPSSSEFLTIEEMVQMIIKSYINLYEHDKGLPETIVYDEVSYDKELFIQALEKYGSGRGIENSKNEDARKIQYFTNQLKKEQEKKEIEIEFLEQEEDKIPKEYFCPLMHNVMKDPVQLPDSKKIVDRVNILRSLLSDGVDPFNRAQLSVEMLIPQQELKKEIYEYIEEKKNKFIKNKQQQS